MALRWILRIALHAVDGYAWVGSLVTAALGVAWLLQTLLGAALPSGANQAIAPAISHVTGPASVVLLIAVLMQASARAGMDEQREGSVLSPAHIADLHRQARSFQANLMQANYYVEMNQTTISARNFGQHFPDIANDLQAWNKEAAEWLATLHALNARIQVEELKPVEGQILQIWSVMQAVGMGTYSSPLEVRWAVAQVPPVGGVYNLGFRDLQVQQDITVATIPGEADPLQFASAVQSRLLDVRNSEESVRIRETTIRLDEMRSKLSLELEAVQLNHSPGGNCDTCRPSKNARS